MPSASKQKGNRGESELARILASIFAGNFARVPNSGAFIGGKNAGRKTALSLTQNRLNRGDLIPPDHMPKFVVEVKNYAGFRFHQLLGTACCPQLDQWIGQILGCIDPGDHWFVAFKVSRIGWFVAAPLTPADYVFRNYGLYHSPHAPVGVTRLPDFFVTNRDVILRQTA